MQISRNSTPSFGSINISDVTNASDRRSVCHTVAASKEELYEDALTNTQYYVKTQQNSELEKHIIRCLRANKAAKLLNQAIIIKSIPDGEVPSDVKRANIISYRG